MRQTTPREHKCHPAVKLDAAFERERTIGRNHRVGLRAQQPREHNAAAGRNPAPQWQRQTAAMAQAKYLRK